MTPLICYFHSSITQIDKDTVIFLKQDAHLRGCHVFYIIDRLLSWKRNFGFSYSRPFLLKTTLFIPQML